MQLELVLELWSPLTAHRRCAAAPPAGRWALVPGRLMGGPPEDLSGHLGRSKNRHEQAISAAGVAGLGFFLMEVYTSRSPRWLTGSKSCMQLTCPSRGGRYVWGTEGRRVFEQHETQRVLRRSDELGFGRYGRSVGWRHGAFGRLTA